MAFIEVVYSDLADLPIFLYFYVFEIDKIEQFRDVVLVALGL
jgi:hypothetical protein